ncbi:hypothetical protein BJ170DRAFT_615556 [Xylariales sp. AK1849]|nr:hypothetical protein BJ170DRAFT_615556 [Xylariales sp. AK1849]
MRFMSSLTASKRLPTHSQLIDFFNLLLPPHPQDIPHGYHVPRWPGYDPNSSVAHHIVLSITPTAGVYARLTELAKGSRKAVCFLHRPFDLDRRALPRGSLVLANHKRFDELMTVGFNVVLASRLGMVVPQTSCIQGYKGDPERRIGIVGQLSALETVQTLRTKIHLEFGTVEVYEAAGGPDESVDAIAIMNAFGPDEVARVVQARSEARWVENEDVPKTLYLTGQPRDLGLQAARVADMPVACVGHREAEVWGIRHLAQELTRTWPCLGVHTVFEEEARRDMIS